VSDQRSGGIAWTDHTWNPIRGCRRKNKDCIHCYAETVAARFSGPGQAYAGLVDEHGRWNGTIRMVEDHLEDPLRWKRPRLVFVNSMSDLFYEELATADIDRIVAVMGLSARHTFQVLTKRPERMLAYLSDATLPARLATVVDANFGMRGPHEAPWKPVWPLPNVWWGASMGHQAAAVAFTPVMQALRPHAAVVWASIEPQTEEVVPFPITAYDWLVLGGESGRGAREFHLEWPAVLILHARQCGVRVFMKQVGRNPMLWGAPYALDLDVTHGGDPLEWPEWARVREWPAIYAGVAPAGAGVVE
jgi:protein gp37